jgi:hypothetical protein
MNGLPDGEPTNVDAPVPGNHSGVPSVQRHHDDEERVIFLPPDDAELSVCQFV